MIPIIEKIIRLTQEEEGNYLVLTIRIPRVELEKHTLTKLMVEAHDDAFAMYLKGVSDADEYYQGRTIKPKLLSKDWYDGQSIPSNQDG